MRVTEFFHSVLGAKLSNYRWSWGASDSEGRLFLRVWKDEFRIIEGRECVVVLNKWSEKKGRSEREEHLTAMRGGATAYGVVCHARDPSDRNVDDVETETLLELGDLIEDDAYIYAIVAGKTDIEDIVAH